MNPLDEAVVDALDLEAAAGAEALWSNPLLPNAPGWEWVLDDLPAFLKWARIELSRGFSTSPQVVVSSRKAGFGIRPFSIWGVLERVLYRGLVESILESIPSPDRGAPAHREFLLGPLRHWSRTPGGIQGATGYVVKTDVVSFYQYIDHRMLAEELLFLTGEKAKIDALMDLLRDVQGRTFGLPQALWPSHRLAEIYLSILDRQLLRHGIAAWRYSDDLRIACDNYGQALYAIEQLDESLRALGLVMSEQKTSTPTLETYTAEVIEVFGNDELPEQLAEEPPETRDQDDNEDEDDEYDDAIAAMALARAIRLIRRTGVPTKGKRRAADSLDITRLSPEDYKLLRTAWSVLIENRDEAGIDEVPRFFTYVPGLTAHASKYLVVMSDEFRDQVIDAVDVLVARVALTDWQRGWIADAMGKIVESDGWSGKHADVRDAWASWLSKLSSLSTSTPWLRAQAILALSVVAPHRLDFDTVDRMVRLSSGSLVTWYVEVARRISRDDLVLSKRYFALVDTTPNVRWMGRQ